MDRATYRKGYKEYRTAGKISSLPKMLGFQAAGAAPLVAGRPVAEPKTVATAIRIGNPASWKGAVAARDESGGVIRAVADREILQAYRKLATLEGVFVEPASAASVAGVKALARRGYFRAVRDRRVVCILTGHGLKDPGTAVEQFQRVETVEPRAGEIAATLKLQRRK